MTHHLQGQLVPGWNVYDNNSNTSDVYGHGTKVAGVIAPGKDIYYGYGRVDAGAAVLAAGDQSGTAPVTDTQAPIVSITSPTGGSVSGTVQVTAAASDETIEDLDKVVQRASTVGHPIRFHGHGHKVSFSTIGRECLEEGRKYCPRVTIST